MPGTNKDGSFDVVIHSDLDEARRLQEDIENRLQQLGFDDRDIFGIRLALEEALVNAIKHGNQMDRGKKVFLQGQITPQSFEIRITDEGPGFDPEELPDPLAVENLECPNGRGIFLMRHYMTEVNILPPGNRIAMSKVRGLKSVNGY